jgi:hypothetical protein
MENSYSAQSCLKGSDCQNNPNIKGKSFASAFPLERIQKPEAPWEKPWEVAFKLAQNKGAICWKRRCQIKVEPDNILKSEFWDKYNIECPVIERDPSVDEVIEWSMKQKSNQ